MVTNFTEVNTLPRSYYSIKIYVPNSDVSNFIKCSTEIKFTE